MILRLTPVQQAHVAVALRQHIRRLHRDGVTPPVALEALTDLLLSGPERPELAGCCGGCHHEKRVTDPVLVDACAAANRLMVSGRTLRRLAASGAITQVRIGRRAMYHRSDLDAFIAASRTTRRAV